MHLRFLILLNWKMMEVFASLKTLGLDWSPKALALELWRHAGACYWQSLSQAQTRLLSVALVVSVFPLQFSVGLLVWHCHCMVQLPTYHSHMRPTCTGYTQTLCHETGPNAGLQVAAPSLSIHCQRQSLGNENLGTRRDIYIYKWCIILRSTHWD